MTRRIAVIGGGLAGIAAALRCADAGAEVRLLEARPRLGGLTHSFQRGALQVDNGQHVFLRCCTAYRQLLERLGVGEQVHLQPRLDIAVRSPDGTTARLWRDELPAPLHLARSLLRYSPLTPLDRVRAVRGALALRRIDTSDPDVDAQSFGQWLGEHGQNRRVTDALWDLVGVATLNAHAADASLALAATVMQLGLLTDRAAGDIGWAQVPLQRLHGDAAEVALLQAGAHVRTGAKVAALEQRGGRWAITDTDGGELVVDQVVLAVPPPAAEALAPRACPDRPDGWGQRLGSSPIVNVHIVFDRQVLTEPFFAGVHSPVHWVFDRTASAGLERGQYLAVSLSAAHAYLGLTTEQLRRRILPALAALLPTAGAAHVRDFFVTKQANATFDPAPGSAALRPPNATGEPGLALAGAWTATGWPATMEGAVRSGNAAADVLLGSRVPAAAGGVHLG